MWMHDCTRRGFRRRVEDPAGRVGVDGIVAVVNATEGAGYHATCGKHYSIFAALLVHGSLLSIFLILVPFIFTTNLALYQTMSSMV